MKIWNIKQVDLGQVSTVRLKCSKYRLCNLSGEPYILGQEQPRVQDFVREQHRARTRRFGGKKMISLSFP